MDKKFLEWVDRNKLVIQKSEWENVFSIEEIGVFYLLFKKNIVLDKDFNLVLTETEGDFIQKHKINFVVYEFGSFYYYSKVDQDLRNKEGKFYIPAILEDFKYLGKARRQLDWRFSHLGIHDEYELLNGMHKAKHWCKKAKFLGHNSLAIVDKNTLAGILAFQIDCLDNGIKPIFGETIVISDNEDQKITYELKLYVKDKVGWKNLLKINKVINIERSGFVTEEELFQYSEGLILVFNKGSIINGIETNLARNIIKKYKKYFKDIYYQIDTVRYKSLEFEKKNLLAIKQYLNNLSDLIEPVLINDTYYLEPEECRVKQSLNKVDRKSRPFSENEYYKDVDDSFQFIESYFNPDKVFKNGLNHVELLNLMVKNSNLIAKKCDFIIPIGQSKLPKFEYVGDKLELFSYLIEEGWKHKIKDKIDSGSLTEYKERKKYEFDFIAKSGLIDYFLILWDIVFWCKSNNIMVGTGRGSVCGSLVAYLIDITSVDPIKYDLLFSRFMNETRFSEERKQKSDALPDVDLDFQAERKDEVKRYMEEKYGAEYVASVGTYTRMKLKGVMKDFARVNTDLSPSTMNFLTKNIDDQQDYKFDDLFKYSLQNNELKKFVQSNKKLVEELKFVLGQAKTPSIHASAVLIMPKTNDEGEKLNVFDWIPTRKVLDKTNKKFVLVSEWEGKYVERAGFLKEDILGLSQLDKFSMIVRMIKKNHRITINFDDIPLDDKNVYRIFKKGFNEDVFQFQTDGMKKYSRFVKPTNIEDLIAMSALYRPGPMSSNAHITYGEIKHGNAEPEYDYGLKEVTEKTQGLYIYQEQIMKALVVGGLTESESDECRSCIKKFDYENMNKFKSKFIDGMVKILSLKCD